MKRQVLAGFGCGILFAVGLALSGMTQPAKVLGFLDFFGRWDPTLALVMVAAIGTHGVLYRRIMRRAAPVLATEFSIPKKRDLDAPLLLGSALFGAGWGLSGYCPGPVVISLAAGGRSALAFAGGMILGMAAYGLLQRQQRGTLPAVGART
jgi:uncharacterized membrane protein YedE/YeeE